MKNIGVAIFILVVIVILGLVFASFQVRETESALVMTFGKPTREITKPGWYFKWPPPIEWVYKFDSRLRVFEADLGETTTKGAVPIIVNTYIVWKVAEPLQFFNAVGSVREAESKLLSQINDTQNRVIGQHFFGEFVNSDPDKIKFSEIENEMLADLQQAVKNANYGIEIRTLGIKQLKISEDVSKDVFERMKAERNRRTETTIAQGNAEATKIKKDADSKRTELLAAAEARAKAIRAEGEAEAAKYFEMLEADAELAMFLRKIESLEKTLQEKVTLVFGPETEPFDLLVKLPKLNLAEPNEPKESKEKLSLSDSR